MGSNAYQERVVSYEKIHSIDEKDFQALVALVNPENGQAILDACCGYGAVSKRLAEYISAKSLNTKIMLLDSSELQLDRAREELKGQGFEFFLSDARNTPFEGNYFDTVVIKMGLHEVDKESQAKMLEEFYRIIKPGGKIVIWELALDEKTREVWRKENTVFHLDTVKNVGKIFEIELQKRDAITPSDKKTFKDYQNKLLPYLGKVIKGSNVDLVKKI